jgi:hypothetical protein
MARCQSVMNIQPDEDILSGIVENTGKCDVVLQNGRDETVWTLFIGNSMDIVH